MSCGKFESKEGFYIQDKDDNGRVILSGSTNVYVNSDKGIDKSGESGIMKRPKTPDEVSALGENYFEIGFSEANLKKHWGSGGEHDHKKDYPELHSADEYNAYAIKLLSSKADGKKILGYKMKDGTIVRYKVDTNDYVKGNPIYDDIFTCFRPDLKAVYFHNHKRIDKGVTK